MDKEKLIAAGLTEEQATEVLKLHKDSIDGAYVPKATFDAEREKAKTLTTQLAERDTQISDLGKFKGDAEQLKAKVDALEEANKTAAAKYEADLQAAQLDAAIKLEIMGKVVDAEDVIPKLDASKIVFKEGKIESGLTEQLDALKKSKPHYFKSEENGGGGNNKPPGWLFGKTPADGADGGSGNETLTDAQKFGKLLADSKASGDNTAAKAAEHYFK